MKSLSVTFEAANQIPSLPAEPTANSATGRAAMLSGVQLNCVQSGAERTQSEVVFTPAVGLNP